MSIIITGGAGFIGSCLISEMNLLGDSDIIVVDNIANTSKWLNINNKKISNYVNKKDFLNDLDDYKNVSAIIHLGACSSTVEKDFDYLWKNNVQFSKKIWDHCCKYQIKFIFASSASIYGNGNYGFCDEKTDQEYIPLNRYAFSKLAFERYVEEKVNKEKILPQYIGLRFFNVYGPNEYHKGNMASIIKMLAALESVILGYILVKKLPICYLNKWCKKKEVWYIVVVVFSLILLMTKIIDYNMTWEFQLEDYIFILVALSLLWMLCFRLMRYRYEERLRKRYFEAFESVVDQIRSRHHKFQNHLDAVYSLHNLYAEYEVLVEEQRKYLKKLTDYEMPAEVMVLKNPILIAHVYEKITEAQEAGLRIRMKLRCDLERCEMNEIHMIEILGTLFDNAIQDMKQTGQTEFLIFEVEKEDGIIVRVANPHEELKNKEIRQMFERGYSTKGKNRGIGLYHVKKLVQKHTIELLVENRIIEEQNYLCFSVIIGRSTPLF